jgi:hypothetical protein
VAGDDFENARLKFHIKQCSTSEELPISKQRSSLTGVVQMCRQSETFLDEKDILAKPRLTVKFLFHGCLVLKFICYNDGTHLQNQAFLILPSTTISSFIKESGGCVVGIYWCLAKKYTQTG